MHLSRSLALIFLLTALSLSASQAAPNPAMTVTMTVDGQPRDPRLAPRIGVGVPVVITWTLVDAPATASWETCRFPSRTPGIVIDSVVPPPVDPATMRWAAETRSVTLTLHGDGSVADYVRTEVALCYARLADLTTPSAVATMRVQPIYGTTRHLPITEQAPFTPPVLPPYPAP